MQANNDGFVMFNLIRQLDRDIDILLKITSGCVSGRN